jgi:restriction system protein
LQLLKPARPTTTSQPRAPEAPTTPLCPQCGGHMVTRTAKQGAHASATFWGCTQYPKCRGTRPTSLQ